jgi:GrpB-like predicted nucleotidyltransferase (UPF0157 family)
MRVFLVEYDAGWPDRFTEERGRIVQTLRDHRPDVEHIGSTAIPGMAAKPIIDIMVLIDDIEDSSTCIERLRSLEYHYYPYGEDVFPERRWFCKPNPAQRTHHLHLVERGTPFHVDHLLFRDYLRTNTDVARSYAALKRQLAERFPDDRDGYTDAKSDFVANVLQEARAESGQREIPSTDRSPEA